MRRLQTFALGLLLVFLSACAERGLSFNGVDITGANFGAGFHLTDHTGKARQLSDFRGKAVTLFFGYTHCPDFCPTSLAGMREVKRLLGPQGDRLQVLFVTVDPARDTQEVLANYVPNFDPSFIGLRGDDAQTAEVGREFKVFFQKVQGKTPDSYTMDHSASTFVFDPQGRLRLMFKYGMEPAAMADDLRKLLG
ncbi:MAG: SCO family protein [Rhodocyclaceae bacterium]|nr:SCO family protein [Rhodocyclaceae bacterium]MBX3671069.1 SCO family protein [Rhodocyclaceae bacterium]